MLSKSKCILRANTVCLTGKLKLLNLYWKPSLFSIWSSSNSPSTESIITSILNIIPYMIYPTACRYTMTHSLWVNSNILSKNSYLWRLLCGNLGTTKSGLAPRSRSSLTLSGFGLLFLSSPTPNGLGHPTASTSFRSSWICSSVFGTVRRSFLSSHHWYSE